MWAWLRKPGGAGEPAKVNTAIIVAILRFMGLGDAVFS
jgi:hypothetical protein